MTRSRLNLARQIASMKVPPERKGNPREYRCQGAARRRLNESPSKKRKGNEDGLGFYFGKCTRPQ